MDNDLVLQALKLMIVGMGTVFLFLSFMIFLLNLQSKIVTKYFSKLPQPESVHKDKNPLTSEDDIDKEIIAVITAAVKKFRSSKKV